MWQISSKSFVDHEAAAVSSFFCDISTRDSGCAADSAAGESSDEMATTLPLLQQVGANVCME